MRIPQLWALALMLALTACGNDTTKSNDENQTPNSANNGDDMGANNPSGDVGDNGGTDSGDDAGSTGDMGPVGTAVTTTSGPVSGVEEDGILSFKGIPYAAPPVGDLRFRPPEAHPGWDDPLDASDYGAPCPQRDISTGNDFGDEDCLFINVWTPAGAQGLPVMFFIHGGGFVQGQGSLPLYDGANFARRDVVLVTINYRLGPLGFLATEELAGESADDTAGNYGLLDQNHALRWVRDNIAAFGGDPENVTIFGESAGGVSVCGHLGAPMSEGLFARGIIESGSGCGGYRQLRTDTLANDFAVTIGDQFVGEVGCSGADDIAQCLRDLPALETVAGAWSLDATGLGLPPFGLIVDGTVLPEQPIERFRDGTANDVPVITGSNADEATLFTATTRVPTENAYETLINTLFGVLADDLLTIYPASDFASPKAAYNALFSDFAFICPALAFAEAAAGGTEPAYTYHFTRVLPGTAGIAGAFHGLELFYVFGNFDAAPMYTPNADDMTLSGAMMTEWTSFGTDGTLGWPAFEAAAPAIRIFDTTVETVDEIRDGRCGELEAIGLTP